MMSPKKEVKIARELDPLSMVMFGVEAWIYDWSGDIETARKYYDRNIELYPGYRWMYIDKAYFQLTQGESEEAAQMFLKGFEIDNIPVDELEAYKEALKLSGIQGLFEVFLEFELKQEPIDPFDVADVYYKLKDYDKSLDWFERAIEERHFRMTYINMTPDFSDPVFYSNPRFQAILQKMNFPD